MSDATSEAIRLTGLSKRYGRRLAVDQLCLGVRRAEVFGFVGRNGAGKSTVMKMIAGLTLPTAGSIELFGQRQAPGTTSRRLGALIESPGVYPGLSGLDNVLVRATALGVPNPRRDAQEALGLVGLSDVARKRAKTYSLGMKQRLGLALALVGSPNLLLLDEPFNGLDPQGVRDIRTLLLQLNEVCGLTIFVSSHVIDQLGRMASRYGVIREGRLVREMSEAEVQAACADYLHVCCSQPALALTMLQERFPCAAFAMMDDDTIRMSDDVDARAVGEVLAGAGIAVSGMYVHHRDREDLFVRLMGEPGPTDAAAVGDTRPTRPRTPERPEDPRASRGGGSRA